MRKSHVIESAGFFWARAKRRTNSVKTADKFCFLGRRRAVKRYAGLEHGDDEIDAAHRAHLLRLGSPVFPWYALAVQNSSVAYIWKDTCAQAGTAS